MVAIEGLNEAAIGTGLRGEGKEVLVYDAYKVLELVTHGGMDVQDLADYLFSLGLHELGDNAPIFVFLDEGISDDLDESRTGSLRLLH